MLAGSQIEILADTEKYLAERIVEALVPSIPANPGRPGGLEGPLAAGLAGRRTETVGFFSEVGILGRGG